MKGLELLKLQEESILYSVQARVQLNLRRIFGGNHLDTKKATLSSVRDSLLAAIAMVRLGGPGGFLGARINKKAPVIPAIFICVPSSAPLIFGKDFYFFFYFRRACLCSLPHPDELVFLNYKEYLIWGNSSQIQLPGWLQLSLVSWCGK